MIGSDVSTLAEAIQSVSAARCKGPGSGREEASETADPYPQEECGSDPEQAIDLGFLRLAGPAPQRDRGLTPVLVERGATS